MTQRSQLLDVDANSVSVDASIHVEPKSCGCRNPTRHCNRVILESKRYFTIRMLIADQEGDRGLESWDLSVFRFPRPEKWKNTTVNEKVKTLELQFTGEDGMCQSNMEPPDFC